MSLRPACRHLGAVVTVLATLLLTSCSSGPPVPSWQLNARSAAEGALDALLSGDTRMAERDLARARAEVARTGRPELMARLELMHCAALVASLEFGPCERFEALRADAAPAELAYAAYLAGTPLAPAQIELLPVAQRAAATVGDEALATALQKTEDPASRLIAAGTRMRQGRASPAVMQLAVDTASAQGWRRPLLAWLQVQQRRARQAGDAVEAARLTRRIELVAPAPSAAR